MPNIKIEGSTQKVENWKPETGTLVTNTKTTEIYLVSKQFQDVELGNSIILVNLKTGYWNYWKPRDHHQDFEPLNPNYKVTLSNGHLGGE